MASGRPQRPNDPSVMSSLESAVREIQRPGLIEFVWNWRWELGIAAVTAGLSVAIAADLGLVWLAVIAGAGLAAFGALLRWPPARARLGVFGAFGLGLLAPGGVGANRPGE